MKYTKNRNLWINLSLVLFLMIFSSNALFAAAKEKAAGTSKSKTAAADVKAGDCAACHKDKKVLPDNHVATREMPYEGCVVCHIPGQGDAGSLKGKIYGSHLHALRGIKCAMCHGQTKTPEPVEMNQCVACHGATAKLAEKTKDIKPNNPHSSPHYGTDLDCNLCHHQHARSGNYCLQCHKFDFVVP